MSEREGRKRESRCRKKVREGEVEKEGERRRRGRKHASNIR